MTAKITVQCPMQAHFYDIDPMLVVWHGNYTRFFEEARRMLLDKIQYNYYEMEESGYMWPVVDLRIKYIRPIQLHQKFIVEATLSEYENRLRIDYCIKDEETGEVLNKAHSIQVAVQISNREMKYESPPILISKVRAALS